MSTELARLQERERQLERELAALKQTQASPALPMDEESLTQLLGEETARVIATAREAAVSIRTRAEEGATRMLREAAEEAAATRSQAELDAAKRMQEAHLEAQTHLELARNQGRDMANEAREYRERVLADVGRRRELARMQLQQVISGRERLLQAFERARLVAVDVLVEVDELGGEPEELVNLALTTGPVPVMVARPSVPSSTLPSTASAASIAAPSAASAADPLLVGPAGAGSVERADESSPVAMYNASDEEPEVSASAVGAIETITDATVETVETDQTAETAAAPEVVHVDDATSDDDNADDLAEILADDTEIDPTVATATIGNGDATTHSVDADAVETDIVAAPESLDDDDEAQLAPVVSLFAGELDAPVHVDRTEGRSRVAVDELFAKLKVAKAEEIARDVEQASSAAGAAAVSPVVVVEPLTEAASIFEHRDETLVPIVASVARKLKRVLADEQNEVLDVLRRKDQVSDVDALVPVEAEHAKIYAQAIHDDLYQAATGGARFSDPAADPQRRIVDAGIIETLLAEVEEAVVQPLRDRLAEAIAMKATNDKLAQQIRGIYRQWKTSVLDTAAGDLAASAYARGSAAVLVPGTEVRWSVSPGTPACDECNANVDAGVVHFGDAFPTGDLSSPAHLACRCLVVSVGH